MAREAFDSGWRWSEPAERTAVLRRIAEIIRRNAEELIQIDIANNGSLRALFEQDIGLTTSWLKYYAGLTREFKGETMDTPGDTLNFTVREPLGVAVGIVPFNHPFMFAASKIAAALASGNTLVLKPSEYTPLSTLQLGRYLAADGAIPDGVINIIAGEGETGVLLTAHDEVDIIDFQGSAPTGKRVMTAAAETVSPVTLELGGKNPSIVFPDADVETAASGCVAGMNLDRQGQSCGSGSRILVHEEIHSELVAAVVDEFEGTTIGLPDDPETDMGAMVSRDHYERVLEYIDVGTEEGTLRTGGKPATVPDADGYFIEPTVFDDVSPDARLAQEEVFGPVVSVIPWSEYGEMLLIANGTDYGLSASVWTEDLRAAHETVRRLEAGYVWVNQHGRHYMGTPFGGFGQSGIGRLHCMEELYEHTQAKNVNIDLGNSGSHSEWEWN